MNAIELVVNVTTMMPEYGYEYGEEDEMVNRYDVAALWRGEGAWVSLTRTYCSGRHGD